MTDNEDFSFDFPEQYVIAKEYIDKRQIKKFYAELSKIEYAENTDILEQESQGLFSETISVGEKCSVLTKLAYTGEIWAFRVMQRYLEETPDGENTDWALISLCECQRKIEADLEEESHGIIYTGLGGKGNSLRYIFVVKKKYDNDNTYDEIKKTWQEVADTYGAEIEEIRIEEKYVWVKVLLKMEVAIGVFIEKGITRINKTLDVF